MCQDSWCDDRNLSVDCLKAKKIKAECAKIDVLCVDTLLAEKKCERYRATVTNSADSVYSLGSPLKWNLVLDDPNSNITLNPVFSYKVPKSGYYILTVSVQSNTLQSTATIVGAPAGKLTVLSNNAVLVSQLATYLAFSDEQHITLSSLVLLNAGDVITMKYEVMALNSSNGEVSVPGTINLEANGFFPASSGFGIHLLSSLDCGSNGCEPRQPAQIAAPRASSSVGGRYWS